MLTKQQDRLDTHLIDTDHDTTALVNAPLPGRTQDK
jgi:hypothetical protein